MRVDELDARESPSSLARWVEVEVWADSQAVTWSVTRNTWKRREFSEEGRWSYFSEAVITEVDSVRIRAQVDSCGPSVVWSSMMPMNEVDGLWHLSEESRFILWQGDGEGIGFKGDKFPWVRLDLQGSVDNSEPLWSRVGPRVDAKGKISHIEEWDLLCGFTQSKTVGLSGRGKKENSHFKILVDASASACANHVLKG